MLRAGKDVLFSLPLKKDSDFKMIRERELAENFDRNKLLNQIRGAYRGAPHFDSTMSLLDSVINFEDCNLFSFYIFNSL